MPFCENCGNPMKEGSRFCVSCGYAAPVETTPVTTTQGTVRPTKSPATRPEDAPQQASRPTTTPAAPATQTGMTSYQASHRPIEPQVAPARPTYSATKPGARAWAIIVISLIFFFPLGLYFLWKNKGIGMIPKIGISALIGLMVVVVALAPPAEIEKKPAQVVTQEAAPQKQEKKTTVEKKSEKVDNTRSELTYAYGKLDELYKYKAAVLDAFSESDSYNKRFSERAQAGDVYGAYNTADEAYWVNQKLAMELLPKIKVPKEMKKAHENYENCALMRQGGFRAYVKAVDNNGKPKFMKEATDDMEYAQNYLIQASAEMVAAIAEQEQRVRDLKAKAGNGKD